MLKKNDIVEIEITGMTDAGMGVGRIDGMVTFVSGAVTGEVVEAKIIKTANGYFVARCEKILTPSPFREESACGVFPRCGGCDFRHIKYEYELELKLGFVESAMKKAGLSDIEVAPVASAGQSCAYRNKVQYPVSDGKIGYFAPHSHNVVPCGSCSLQMRVFDSILEYITDFIKENGISSYDEEKHSGLLRHICLRSSFDGGEVMICLVINGTSLPASDKLVLEVTNRFPNVKSIILSINCVKTNVILGDEYKLLWGRDYIEDTLCGLRFRISAASFYQVNHDGAGLLYSIAREAANVQEGERVADLFCGIGTIGLYIAANSSLSSLVGVEIVPQAVENAKVNAEINGINCASFYCGDADHPALENADVVIIDPPRKGCSPSLINRICDISPRRVVYVSCAPDTLARDLALFRQQGYTCSIVRPVDMFPRTGHVETVVLMSRAGA